MLVLVDIPKYLYEFFLRMTDRTKQLIVKAKDRRSPVIGPALIIRFDMRVQLFLDLVEAL